MQLYTFFKVLCVIFKGDKYMNHKILEHKSGVSVIYIFIKCSFYDFSPLLFAIDIPAPSVWLAKGIA